MNKKTNLEQIERFYREYEKLKPSAKELDVNLSLSDTICSDTVCTDKSNSNDK